jgi:hypothetical protein
MQCISSPFAIRLKHLVPDIKQYKYIHSFSCCSHVEHRAPFGVSVITYNETHGRLLWTSDQPVAETSTCRITQHINTRDKHP